MHITVDWEYFVLKITRVIIVRVDKFLRFRSIREIFLTVDDCNMDECLESLWLLVYYQYQESQGLLAVVIDWTFISGSLDLHASLFTEHRCIIYFSCV